MASLSTRARISVLLPGETQPGKEIKKQHESKKTIIVWCVLIMAQNLKIVICSEQLLYRTKLLHRAVELS